MPGDPLFGFTATASAGSVAGPVPHLPAPAPAAGLAAGEGPLVVPGVVRPNGQVGPAVQFAVPHQEGFQAIWNQLSKMYRSNADEAWRANPEEARAMWRDPQIRQWLTERTIAVASLPMDVVPDDPDDPAQQAEASRFLKILRAIPRLSELKRALVVGQKWTGKGAAKLSYGAAAVGGRRVVAVDGHEPVNGDKVNFSFGGCPGILVRTNFAADDPARWPDGARFRMGDRSGGKFLMLDTPWWRDQFLIHESDREDRDFQQEGDLAGAIHGSGLRGLLYFPWHLKQKLMRWMANGLERLGTGGTYYAFCEEGNPLQEEATLTALSMLTTDHIAVFKTGKGGAANQRIEHIDQSAVNYETIRSFIDYLDDVMQKTIVGQSLTSDTAPMGIGGGKVAEAHESTKESLQRADAEDLAHTLTEQLLGPLVRFNTGGKGLPFRLRVELRLNSQDGLDYAEKLKIAKDLGIDFDVDDARKQLGIVAPPAPGPAPDRPRGPLPAPAKAGGPPRAAGPSLHYAAGPAGLERPSVCVVALIPAAAAADLAVPGGEPAADLHVTLAYLGKSIPRGKLRLVERAVKLAAMGARPLPGTLGGSGIFPAGESSGGKDVAWLGVDVPGLAELRQALVEGLAHAGFAADVTHGWTPHVTLRYLDAGEDHPAPRAPRTPVVFRRLGLWVGGRRVAIPLGLHARRTRDRLAGPPPGDLDYAAAHAPDGGVSIAGTFYDGGRFIPAGVAAQADPATKAEIGVGAGPGLSGDHRLDGLLKRARFGHFVDPDGDPGRVNAEIARDVGAVSAARTPAGLAAAMGAAGIAVPAGGSRAELQATLHRYVARANARAADLTDEGREALPDFTDQEDTPGPLLNAIARAEGGNLHPDDIAPLVDEALGTADGRHDLGQGADDVLGIRPGMDPEVARWRAVVALSRLNRAAGGGVAPEVRREVAGRKQARRERAAAYRADHPEAVARAAAGVPATRAEFHAALARREDDPSLRRRVARRNKSGLGVDDPRHPDPEAAVLGHHLASYRRGAGADRGAGGLHYREAAIPGPPAPKRGGTGARAPIGGVTIDGKSYRGGQWIPGAASARASAGERAALGRTGAPPEPAHDFAAAKVERAEGHLAALDPAAADHHDRVDRIARGVTRDELFRAASGAGIRHEAATKKDLVAHLKKLAAPAPAPPPVDPATHADHEPGHVGHLATHLIRVDPDRFQYKIGAGEGGSVGSLAGVRRYDPELGGILQVWRDPGDGKTYVVNGHNRLDLARKLGADRVTVRYIHAADAREARSTGALTNIAEGRGTAIDAAKHYKDTGTTREQLAEKGIPLREKVATDGLSLAKLDDAAFRRVIDGDLSVEKGAIIGGAGLEPHEQRALLKLLDKQGGRRSTEITNSHLKELTDEVKSSRTVRKTTNDLFGPSAEDESLALHKAKLQGTIKDRLGREKKLFGIVAKSRHAEELARAGNSINVGESARVSRDAASTLAAFDGLKNRSGPVARLLNDAAERIHNGEPAKKVTDETYRRIVQELPRLLEGANLFGA